MKHGFIIWGVMIVAANLVSHAHGIDVCWVEKGLVEHKGKKIEGYILSTFEGQITAFTVKSKSRTIFCAQKVERAWDGEVALSPYLGAYGEYVYHFVKFHYEKQRLKK